MHVIKAINESAFHNSPYPVIICIENHCSKDQQQKMAQILKDVLGKKIYTEPSGTESHLPSPDFLKHRFLIRSKQLPPSCKEDVGYVSEEDEGFEVVSLHPFTHVPLIMGFNRGSAGTAQGFRRFTIWSWVQVN